MKNIAIIGAGYWGRNLVRNYHRLGVLRTVCDTNKDILQNMKAQYTDLKITSSFHQVLNDKEIQGVVIGLPAIYHYSFAKRALLANKDVFVEKPLALDLKNANELNHLATVNDQILMVGHLLRYHSAFLKLDELISSGVLGRIQYIYSNRLSFGKIRTEENSLWSFAPHDISMILALCDEEPNSVTAEGHMYLSKNLADVTTTHLTFPSGINGHIFVSWLHPFKEQKLVVVASEKMAVFEDTQPWEKKLTLYSHHIKWKKGSPIPEKAEPEYVPIEQSEPLLAECQHFVDCMEQRKRPITDGQEGYRVLKVLDKAQKSLEENAYIPSKLLISKDKKPFFVHDSAWIDEPCEIGEGTKIWHFSHIQKNSRIGKNCILGQNVNVANDVTIGNNVKIQNNVSIYTGVEIEDDVFLGPSCVLTNVTNPRSQVNRHLLYERTVFKRGATVGANATIVCGITIGQYAFIGAGAVVTKDLPDYAMVAGVPAKQIGWVSRHCVKLPEPDQDGVMVCPESGMRYKKDAEDKVICLDLAEEEPLPEKMAIGQKYYRDLK